MRCVPIAALILCGCAARQDTSPDALYRNGESLFRQGKLTDALKNAEQGLRAEPSWRFRLLRADIYLSLGDAEKALQTLRSTAAPTDPEQLARLAMHEGYADFLLANYDAAQAALERARAIAAPVHKPLLDAQIGLRRGVLLIQAGRIDEAETNFRGAIQTASQLHDTYLQASATGNLAYLFLRTFRFEQAVYWLSQARDMFQRMGSATAVAKALGNLGSAYHGLGDDDKALTCLREAERQFRDSGNRREQQIWLGNIGNVLQDRGDYTEAVRIYNSALEIARSLNDRYWTGWWLQNLAVASINLKDFDAAERYNGEALRLQHEMRDRSEFYPRIRINEAHIAAGRGDLGKAETLFRTLIAERPATENLTPRLEAQTELAMILTQKKDYDRAAHEFRGIVTAVETSSAALTRDEFKLSYLSSLIQFYREYVNFLVSRNQKTQALEVAESSRARVLDARLRAAGRKQKALDVTALQHLSQSSGAVLLSYWLAPSKSFLWAITPTGITMYELPGEKQIAPLVDSYRKFLEDLRDPLESEFPAGHKLAEILLGPVRPLLHGNARVIIVPDGSLNSLNFETLPDPENPSRYLIDRVTTSVAPSLGILTEPGTREPEQKMLLVMGDPDPAVEEYPKLPYAAKEMSLIERSFSAAHSVVLQGAQAYPAAYRNAEPARFSWIHFAAHASANSESPLESALILSRHDSTYSLTARDVMNIPLHADLVTLSACRSAGARMYSGEGLVGLSWAFLRAGAKTVVAGLWDVTDMSTANLMADFYSQLAKDVAPADALRQAKLRLIQSKGAYRKPFYWGPFQLYVGAGL